MKLIKLMMRWMRRFPIGIDSHIKSPVQPVPRHPLANQRGRTDAAHRMRVGLVGMNGNAFVIAKPTFPDAPWLRERIEALRRKQLNHANGRDFDGAFHLALDLLTEFRGHRYAIIYLTAGTPPGQEAKLDKFLMRAAEKTVAVHGIYFGNRADEEAALQSLCTKSQLGFGSFHSAPKADDLESELGDCLEASIPRPWNKEPNRVVFVVDHSKAMAERINGKSRIAVISEVLAQKLNILS